MKKMMEEFSTMGHKDDFNSTIEGMMKQLLAKDVMYIPMKQICEKVWAHCVSHVAFAGSVSALARGFVFCLILWNAMDDCCLLSVSLSHSACCR